MRITVDGWLRIGKRDCDASLEVIGKDEIDFERMIGADGGSWWIL